MFVSNFMPLVVDHVTRVAITNGYDQPIICTSLGKSTNTTFSASTFGTFRDYSLRSIGVEVRNVSVIGASLETPKEKKTPNVTFNGFSKTIGQPSFRG
jgi:hypothetical protein